MDVQEYPMPEGITRLETGPVKFGDDWTGIFIRGDDAIGFKAAFELLLSDPEDIISGVMIKELLALLSSCEEIPATKVDIT